MIHIVKDFTPSGGKHCITNALKQVFHYYGYPPSEEMIFGLASGLSFTYINLAILLWCPADQNCLNLNANLLID
ncbi:hypothetical protein D3C74_106580 [compost metagenome]